VHQRGDVVEYEEPDARNLAAGKSGHVEGDCPGETCHAVKNGNATIEQEETGEPTDSNNPAGATDAGKGSDGKADRPNDPAANACAACDGKAFATEAALKAHIRAKHPQLTSNNVAAGGALVPPAL
jgi:hypothetical protein